MPRRKLCGWLPRKAATPEAVLTPLTRQEQENRPHRDRNSYRRESDTPGGFRTKAAKAIKGYSKYQGTEETSGKPKYRMHRERCSLSSRRCSLHRPRC